MRKVKFQKPYLVLGHLSYFTEQSQLSKEEKRKLEVNGKEMKEKESDTPRWIQNKFLEYIKTLEKTEGGNSEVPNKAYIVQHNGINFVIGSRGNKEDPVFASFVPEEFFEIE